MQTKPPPPTSDKELTSFLHDVYVKMNSSPRHTTPASSGATGNSGEIAFDDNYLYVWYGENTVARIQYTSKVF